MKLSARALDAPEAVRRAPADAWWSAHRDEAARVVTLRITEAVLVTWDLEGGTMTIARWTPEAATRERTRTYP